MFKSGFIGIVGRPNVGKSTLLNALVGEEVAIATHKPQTTRNRITGIKNLDAPRPGQLIFVDTPGIHRPNTPLNERMVAVALDTLRQVDLLLFVTEAGADLPAGDVSIGEYLRAAGKPAILAINKVDLTDKIKLLPQIDRYRRIFPFEEIIPVSAQTGRNLEILVSEIWKLLPEGQELFPRDLFTDQTERFLAAEIIRKKILLLTHKEVPYQAAVLIESFKEDEARNLIRIQAAIMVEKDSQKAIIIGKGGALLKEIGTEARHELERFFAARVYLELFVRVTRDWSKNPRILKELGYE